MKNHFMKLESCKIFIQLILFFKLFYEQESVSWNSLVSSNYFLNAKLCKLTLTIVHISIITTLQGK